MRLEQGEVFGANPTAKYVPSTVGRESACVDHGLLCGVVQGNM